MVEIAEPWVELELFYISMIDRYEALESTLRKYNLKPKKKKEIVML